MMSRPELMSFSDGLVIDLLRGRKDPESIWTLSLEAVADLETDLLGMVDVYNSSTTLLVRVINRLADQLDEGDKTVADLVEELTEIHHRRREELSLDDTTPEGDS